MILLRVLHPQAVAASYAQVHLGYGGRVALPGCPPAAQVFRLGERLKNPLPRSVDGAVYYQAEGGRFCG